MKTIRFHDLKFIPASHEDQHNPGAIKKVLVKVTDMLEGKVQMINWVRLLPGKSFARHYHEDMDEVFVIVAGSGRITVANEVMVLKVGDAVIVPCRSIHTMTALNKKACQYLAIGISRGKNGQTVVVG